MRQHTLVLAVCATVGYGCGSTDSDSGDPSGTTFESDDFVVVVESDDSGKSRTANVKSKDGSDVLSIEVTRERVRIMFAGSDEESQHEFDGRLEELPTTEDLAALGFYVGGSWYADSSRKELGAIAQKDAPGCDVVPNILDTRRRLVCCAEHDWCYHLFGCTAASWKKPRLNVTGSKESLCWGCNSLVLDCWNDPDYTPVVTQPCYDRCTVARDPSDNVSAANLFTCESTRFGADSCECLSSCEQDTGACEELLECCPNLSDHSFYDPNDEERGDGIHVLHTGDVCQGALGDDGLHDRARRKECDAALAEVRTGYSVTECPPGTGGSDGTGGQDGAGGQGGTGAGNGGACQGSDAAPQAVGGASITVEPNCGLSPGPFTVTTSGFDCGVQIHITSPSGQGENDIGFSAPGNDSGEARLSYCEFGEHVVRAKHLSHCDDPDRQAEATYTVPEPSFQISPTCGPPGTVVTAKAKGFRPLSAARVRWIGKTAQGNDYVRNVVGTTYPDSADGSFVDTFEVPEGLAFGDHEVRGQSQCGGSNAGFADIPVTFRIATDCDVGAF